MKLLSSYGDNNFTQRAVAVQKLVAFLEGILRSPSTSDVFFYLLEHGAATAWVLQVDLNQPESTVYRALKNLRSMDVIVEAMKTQKIKGSKGGPRPKIWALRGSAAEDVARAMMKHYRALSPKYRVAEEMVQCILEDTPRIYEQNEVTYRELVTFLKIRKVPYKRDDVADLMSTILHEKGIKVWR